MAFKTEGMTPLIQVFSMPRALAFYRDLLGFEVIVDSGGGDNASWVWLRLGETDLMLNDQYEPGTGPESPPAARSEWHGDTCFYFNCPDVDGVYEFLTSRGLKPKPPIVTDYGARQVYINDPDGYNLCFQWTA